MCDNWLPSRTMLKCDYWSQLQIAGFLFRSKPCSCLFPINWCLGAASQVIRMRQQITYEANNVDWCINPFRWSVIDRWWNSVIKNNYRVSWVSFCVRIAISHHRRYSLKMHVMDISPMVMFIKILFLWHTTHCPFNWRDARHSYVTRISPCNKASCVWHRICRNVYADIMIVNIWKRVMNRCHHKYMCDRLSATWPKRQWFNQRCTFNLFCFNLFKPKTTTTTKNLIIVIILIMFRLLAAFDAIFSCGWFS